MTALGETEARVEMFDDGSGWTFKWAGAPTKAEWQRSEHVLYVDAPDYHRRPYSKWPEAALEDAFRGARRVYP